MARMGKPQGTGGTVTFMNGRTVAAVRDGNGTVWVRSVNPALWLPCTPDVPFRANN